MVTVTVDVIFRQTEELKSLHHELDLSNDAIFQINVIVLKFQEVVSGLSDFEPKEPVVEQLIYHVLLAKLFLRIFFVLDEVVHDIQNVARSSQQVLLQGYALRNDVAFHCLLLKLALGGNLFVL
jgi:hypothetical protein